MDLQKVFRDPVYNLISFDKKEDKPILEIINTPEFQRLRRIRQLGLSSYTYPTAVHDRFSHSLGVTYIVGLLFDNLNIEEKSVKITTPDGDTIPLNKKELKLLIQLAGLLHDIGHGPFSHAFEKITKVDHEEMSKEIILNENGNIYPILKGIDNEILAKHSPQWIVEIITGGTFEPIWVKELISSQLDADRMDYLLRDAYMCGVNYASFDYKWLFQNIELGEIKNENNRKGLLINAKKGIHAVESFIISRYHMYEQVYFHKTTRCFEVIAHKIFERLKRLKKDNKLDDSFFLNKSLPSFIETSSLDDYLLLDDFNLYTHFNHWIFLNKDSILKQMCETIIYRRPYKLFKEIENDSLFEYNTQSLIMKTLGKYSDEPEYLFLEDKYSNIPYKDTYLLGKSSSENASHIWLKGEDLREFSEVSPIIGSLKNRDLKRKRAYIPHEYYKEIVELVNS